VLHSQFAVAAPRRRFLFFFKMPGSGTPWRDPGAFRRDARQRHRRPAHAEDQHCQPHRERTRPHLAVHDPMMISNMASGHRLDGARTSRDEASPPSPPGRPSALGSGEGVADDPDRRRGWLHRRQVGSAIHAARDWRLCGDERDLSRATTTAARVSARGSRPTDGFSQGKAPACWCWRSWNTAKRRGANIKRRSSVRATADAFIHRPRRYAQCTSRRNADADRDW